MPLPQPPALNLTKITKGMRPGADEKKSAWVVFPHLRCQYMLPIVQKGRKLVPQFYDDGSVGVEAKDGDPMLGQMVDSFLLSISRKDASEKQALVGLDGYQAFILLLKTFLLANYDLTTEDLMSMLTMTTEDFAMLHQIMLRHCLGV